MCFKHIPQLLGTLPYSSASHRSALKKTGSLRVRAQSLRLLFSFDDFPHMTLVPGAQLQSEASRSRLVNPELFQVMIFSPLWCFYLCLAQGEARSEIPGFGRSFVDT